MYKLYIYMCVVHILLTSINIYSNSISDTYAYMQIFVACTYKIYIYIFIQLSMFEVQLSAPTPWRSIVHLGLPPKSFRWSRVAVRRCSWRRFGWFFGRGHSGWPLKGAGGCLFFWWEGGDVYGVYLLFYWCLMMVTMVIRMIIIFIVGLLLTTAILLIENWGSMTR